VIISRFAGGLTVDIEQPDTELKLILQMKARKYLRDLPPELQLIADRVQDTRTLEDSSE
jgi:chromosomal replication initiation ATPase DnaA